MKILQIIQRPQLRGAEIFACQLSKELIVKGHTVDVLYLFTEENNLSHFELNFITLDAHEEKRFTDFVAYKRLASIIEEGGYDIIQANAGDTLKYAAISKRLHNWKAKLVFRNANKMSGFIKSKPHLWLNQFFLKQVDYFISVSENCRYDLIQLYPNAKHNSATGTIGTFDYSNIKAVDKHTNNKIWINVGAFVKEKNHRFLLDVFAEYLKIDQQNELWLIGSGSLKTQLESHAKRLEITQKVKFWGYRQDAISYIKAADVMVMPSKIEGLPGVILESMACGTPVVASDVGGIPEVVKNDETGFVINEQSIEVYLDKIQKLFEDKTAYQLFSNNGVALIKSKFLLPSLANRFESIYDQITR